MTELLIRGTTQQAIEALLQNEGFGLPETGEYLVDHIGPEIDRPAEFNEEGEIIKEATFTGKYLTNLYHRNSVAIAATAEVEVINNANNRVRIIAI